MRIMAIIRATFDSRTMEFQRKIEILKRQNGRQKFHSGWWDGAIAYAKGGSPDPFTGPASVYSSGYLRGYHARRIGAFTSSSENEWKKFLSDVRSHPQINELRDRK